MKRHTIGGKIIAWLLVFTACLIVFLGVLLGIRYYNAQLDAYREVAISYALQLGVLVEPDSIQRYLETKQPDREYTEIELAVSTVAIDENIECIYVFVPDEEGITYVWDSDEEMMAGKALGVKEKYAEGDKEAIRTTMESGEITGLIVSDTEEYGLLGTAYIPLLDYDYNPVAVIGVDISIPQVRDSTIAFVATYTAGVVAFAAALAFVLYRHINRNLVQPLGRLNVATQHMVQNLDAGDSVTLDVHTGDELEELADSFGKMYADLGTYVRENERITSEKQRMDTELELAAKIQVAMLPRTFPAFPEHEEFDIHASMVPAKEVGGDFYDFFMVDDDHLCMVMADVSGKGIPAALFMMMSKTTIANVAITGKGPGAILAQANDKIFANNPEKMFVTVWVGILELSSGRMRCANAGHERPVIQAPGQAFEVYKDKHGLVLGVMPGMPYVEYEIEMAPGSKLFMYTDGLPEANNAGEELFGMDRTVEALNRVCDGSPREVLDGVAKAVGEFVGEAPQFDDLTMLCVEYLGVGSDELQVLGEITLEASTKNASKAIDFVEKTVAALDPSEHAVVQLGIAVDEVFSNVARYAYQDDAGSVSLTVSAHEPSRTVTITFMDEGVAYDPTTTAAPNTDLPAGERAQGGYGVFLVKKIMDSVCYERRGNANVLTLTKSV